jgi:hypothetical protein
VVGLANRSQQAFFPFTECFQMAKKPLVKAKQGRYSGRLCLKSLIKEANVRM